jgi:hypothetical protein
MADKDQKHGKKEIRKPKKAKGPGEGKKKG